MLKVSLCGVELKNPVIMASGTFGFGREYAGFYDLSRLGGICTKGLTLEPREGNSGRRSHETAMGMLNSVGLQNPGVAAFIKAELPFMLGLGTAVIANVGGSEPEDYIKSVELLNGTGVSVIELNISCPNVKRGGMAYGIKAATAYAFVREIKRVCKKPLMVKLSPNAENIIEMAAACEDAGADALSLINTLKGMAVDVNTRRPVFDNVFAGLSGPAVKPVALRMVYEVCKSVKAPVVGIGGIACAADVLEFIMAGAAAVQVGTANFVNPMCGAEIVDELPALMERLGIKTIDEVRGAAL
ncbi:MAG: dihydroorotate dehydrogenase [Oscillospiraceae bacterium]|nr:dihydroorotate dehydrogenase [Oscillospiraceae bacterium]